MKRRLLLITLLSLLGAVSAHAGNADLPRVTPEEFDQKILPGYGMKIVEVWASWCPHCRNTEPAVDEFTDRYSKQIPVYILDYDKYRDYAKSLGVEKIPTFLLYHQGKRVDKLQGERDVREIARWVNRYARPYFGAGFLTLPPKKLTD
ncbi:MAG: hypothetical protein GC134_06515 [Proteobacteria bacterium]|nr:hypothetical protein [Pseudomonadota bacterium]